ncbi:hypothetical protein M422DRAFT_30162 [Sphaerobolus stellatus SS14]|uniref:Uncharacterized protein n=1 Tax=Sphaerobolus stellatus (strain SS14) TaxID=990650 RepID=A0A0C9W1X2_SPHS4|nr:hypothetical protein M422DRAFT_30162 [Sphaerobolus stellatus SS14]
MEDVHTMKTNLRMCYHSFILKLSISVFFCLPASQVDPVNNSQPAAPTELDSFGGLIV